MKKIFFTLALSAMTLTACTNQITKTDQPAITNTLQPISSPTDPKKYLNFQLENGLNVLVISDPQADKAAASLNVTAGSYQEPNEFPGLAHFLEHLLFLGTEKYPQPDAYADFISQHGGSHNAFTASQDTNYFFDIQPAYLDGALDRLAQFFIAPLLDATYIEREVNAVDSEWSGTLADDNRLAYEALRQAFNPAHPAARFSAGNKASLDISNPELLPTLLDFHQRYYTAKNMSLVVLGQDSTHKLRQQVEKHFGAIASGTHTTKLELPPLFLSQQLPAVIEYLPLSEKYQLELLFPIPSQTKNYRKKASHYLANLIGHEGQGSLLALLKEQGLATGLSAGSSLTTGTQDLFSLKISLTPKGDQHREQVLGLAFAYLDLIRHQGIEHWRYTEEAQIAHNAFTFTETAPATSAVTHLAMSLSRYPAVDVIQAPYLFNDFDPVLIQQLAELLIPENLLLVHTSPQISAQKTAQWLPAHYNYASLDIQRIPTSKTTKLHLPKPNGFIPQNLKLINGRNAAQPKLLLQETGLEVWQGLDTSFKAPRAQTFISLQKPQVALKLKENLLARLAASWLNDQLNASAYPARLAGLNYQIYAHQRGLTLALGGFNEKQPLLIQQMLQELQNGQVNKQQFARLKHSLSQDLNNRKQDRVVEQLIRQFYLSNLQPQGWTTAQQLEQLAQINQTDLTNFLQQLHNDLYIQILSWGNTDSASTLELAAQVKTLLRPSLTAQDVNLMQAKIIPAHAPTEQVPVDHPDQALFMYLQGQDTSLKEEALILLTTQLQKAAFFHELRTEQQLGYAVFNGSLPLMQQPGMFYYVQSPQYQADYLKQQFQEFLQKDLQRLANLTTAEFNQHKASLIGQLTQQDQRLSQRANRFWQEIGMQNYNFSHREQLAKTLKKLNQKEFLEFYQRLLNAPNIYWLSTSN